MALTLSFASPSDRQEKLTSPSFRYQAGPEGRKQNKNKKSQMFNFHICEENMHLYLSAHKKGETKGNYK